MSAKLFSKDENFKNWKFPTFLLSKNSIFQFENADLKLDWSKGPKGQTNFSPCFLINYSETVGPIKNATNRKGSP